MSILEKHKKIETHATLLLVLSFLVVTIGGLVEIVPLFYLQNTIEKVQGVRPTPPSNWPAAASISARVAMSATAR